MSGAAPPKKGSCSGVATVAVAFLVAAVIGVSITVGTRSRQPNPKGTNGPNPVGHLLRKDVPVADLPGIPLLALKQMEAAKQQSADAKVGAGISAADAPHRHEINVPKETIAVAVNQDISSATGQGKAQADGGAGEGIGATVAPELALKRQQKIKAKARKYEYEEMFIEHPRLDAITNQVKEKTIQARVKSVFVLHAKAFDGAAPRATPVLLLHGAKFSTKTWDSAGTIAALTESRYDVYALDLPGYGRSEGKVDAVLKEVFLKGIIAKLKLKRPVIVSPSMSGSFSIPLILKDPELVSGFVSVAAVKIAKLEKMDWSTSDLLLLHIYGEKDTMIGKPGAQVLTNVRDGHKGKAKKNQSIQLFMMNKASHACYLDNPAAFNKRLLKFVERVNKRRRKDGNMKQSKSQR